jgi:hypothetical protein
MERCEECGFDYDLGRAPLAGAAVIEGASQLARILAGGGDELRARLQPERWSPLEYGCHLRDVLLVQRERVLLARRESRPELQPMGRDERVDHDGYAEQQPGDVARQLRDAAQLLANVLSRLGDGDWQRTVIYSYPAPEERSLRWVATHTLHEVRHHLLDVEGQLPASA